MNNEGPHSLPAKKKPPAHTYFPRIGEGTDPKFPHSFSPAKYCGMPFLRRLESRRTFACHSSREGHNCQTKKNVPRYTKVARNLDSCYLACCGYFPKTGAATKKNLLFLLICNEWWSPKRTSFLRTWFSYPLGGLPQKQYVPHYEK